MPRRVYLHVGLPKTGTTLIQELLWHNRSTLAGAGVLYPGYVHAAQFHAALDLQPERYRDWHEPAAAGAWDRLAEHIRSWPGTSVVSCELLAPATSKQVRRVTEALAGLEVHVVCTARDLARQIPSVWQENVKTGQRGSLPELVHALRTGEPAETSGLFWDYQDLTQILRTWGAGLPPERVHVVTVPQAGPNVWPRFASVLGVRAAMQPPSRDGADNVSLGAVETEFLRRLNGVVDVGWARYAAVVKDQVAQQVLAQRRDTRRITLPAEEYPWLRKQAQQFIDEIREARYDVVGDLADLLPAEPADAGGLPDPSPQELLDAAIDTVAALVPRLPEEWPPNPPGLKDTLVTLSERHPAVMAMRRGYWKGKARISWARRRG
ncbi:hypothetical protein FPZ12_002015 [Amycolatopsis acidicola]|uniref:Sulfotransferase family protein n=1 Tax=Amycolatopsis acidicola TaxID=2596893 RepID=A0A5N0VP13_9PSEU|nr:hypothetical protein [Amycolatopsis acidicola]KAA9166361.1 hypothetical protein FPZ12_002015 [Amycolatopsis acidicola]